MDRYPVDPIGDNTIQFTPINEGMNQVNLEFTASEPALAEIKVETNDEDDGNDESSIVTPKKRGRKDPVVKSEGTPSKKAKGSPAKSNPIPTSLEAAGPEDRLLYQMKETEGRSWAEVGTALEAMTGLKPNIGSLKTRLVRMKAGFVIVEPEHVQILLEKKKEIEDKFEVEKWQRISEQLESHCGKKYPIPTLQKKFKEVSKKVNGAATMVKDEE